MEKTNKPLQENSFAEIIESNCSKFLAQTWDVKVVPKLGALVKTKTGDLIIFGIITSIQTGSQDPMRYPFTYQKTEEELKREQPQIFEFLKTTFDVQIVGSLDTIFSPKKPLGMKQINYSLPSSPPKIHSFVKNADTEMIKSFFSKTDFLSLLFNAQISNLDEILLAILKNLEIDKNFLNKFCSDFALLNGNDYKRLKLFLKRVQQI